MITTGNSYLLDTTVFVDYLRGIPAAKNVVNNITGQNIVAGYSIITVAELWEGITPVRPEAQHLSLLKFFRLYPIDLSIAKRSGELRGIIRKAIAKKPGEGLPSVQDCIIAATAEAYHLTVCTRNN